MPLPAGFKVNGAKVASESRMPVPPRVRKMIALLDTLPASELFTTMELAGQIGMSLNGAAIQHPVLREYREKVDGKLFWGSRKSIAQLRKQLAEPEKSYDEN